MSSRSWPRTEVMTNDTRATYVMIGGFLGAGKTTAVDQLARRLTDRGLRVGLITNDQSSGLVDTSILRSRGFAVEEIAGGCFCCRFGSLAEAADRLESDARPDVFLAEPVGSCTDLVATVSYPLRRLYGDRFRIAPLSVLVDPARARRILGLADGRSFSEKVVYVYEKQLEEADLIVVNKTDTLSAEECDELVAALAKRFPHADVIRASLRNGEGTDAWFDRIVEDEASVRPTMPLDYDLYAEGEALLGWLNATVRLTASEGPVDANALLVDLASEIRARLATEEIEIAHLKATLDAGDAAGRLAALSITSGEEQADLREALVDGVEGGELVLNLRAEGDPDLLRRIAAESLDACTAARPGLTGSIEHEEFFRPAPPTPTHRDEIAAEV
ncbi:MAG: GTP-binding protein [Planctomycetota bacterium]